VSTDKTAIDTIFKVKVIGIPSYHGRFNVSFDRTIDPYFNTARAATGVDFKLHISPLSPHVCQLGQGPIFALVHSIVYVTAEPVYAHLILPIPQFKLQ
jgi:hypothetical protein